MKAIHLYLNFPEKKFMWLIIFYCTFNAPLALNFMCASGIQCKADFFFFLLLVILPFNWRNCASWITNILTYFLSFWFFLSVPFLLYFLSSYFLLDWDAIFVWILLPLFPLTGLGIIYILIFMIIAFEICSWKTKYKSLFILISKNITFSKFNSCQSLSKLHAIVYLPLYSNLEIITIMYKDNIWLSV